MTRAAAATIVDGILRDICDRDGLQNAWEEIDDDIQEEIRDAWIDIVLARGEDAE